MAHLYLLSLILSLMIALLSAGVYIFLYQKYKLDLIRYFLVHLAATIMMVFLVALNFYLYLNMGVFNSMMKILFGYTSSMLLFSSPLIYTTPIFIRALAGKENTKKVKFFFSLMALTSAMNGIIIFGTGYQSAFHTITNIYVNNLWLFLAIWTGVILLFTSFSYSYIFLFRNYRHIVDPVRKVGARYLIIYFFVSIFLIYFDFEMQKRQLLNQKYPVGIFLQPLSLFIFSCISLAVLHSGRKLNIQKSKKIPHGFVLKYNITDREIEIIDLIITGLSTKEIASRLFLSPSTVRNHISNIFAKTNVPTRGKLHNLIKNSQ